MSPDLKAAPNTFQLCNLMLAQGWCGEGRSCCCGCSPKRRCEPSGKYSVSAPCWRLCSKRKPCRAAAGASLGKARPCAVVAIVFMVGLYGCLPDSKNNLCCVAKKSAAHLYPALIALPVWFPRLARWPRCISADKRLISWSGLFVSEAVFRFSSSRSDPFHITSLFTASLPYKD